MVLESMFINKNFRCNNYKTFLKLSLFIPKIYHKSLIYLPLIRKSTAILNNPIIMDIAVDKNLVICIWLNLGLLLSFMINIFQNLKCLTCSIGRYLNFSKMLMKKMEKWSYRFTFNKNKKNKWKNCKYHWFSMWNILCFLLHN